MSNISSNLPNQALITQAAVKQSTNALNAAAANNETTVEQTENGTITTENSLVITDNLQPGQPARLSQPVLFTLDTAPPTINYQNQDFTLESKDTANNAVTYSFGSGLTKQVITIRFSADSTTEERRELREVVRTETTVVGTRTETARIKKGDAFPEGYNASNIVSEEQVKVGDREVVVDTKQIDKGAPIPDGFEVVEEKQIPDGFTTTTQQVPDGPPQRVVLGPNDPVPPNAKLIDSKQVQVGVNITKQTVPDGNNRVTLNPNDPVPPGAILVGSREVADGFTTVKQTVPDGNDRVTLDPNAPVPDGAVLVGTREVPDGFTTVKQTVPDGTDRITVLDPNAPVPDGAVFVGSRVVDNGTTIVKQTVPDGVKRVTTGVNDPPPPGGVLVGTQQVPDGGTVRVKVGERIVDTITKDVSKNNIPDGFTVVPGSERQVQTGTQIVKVPKEITETVIDKQIIKVPYTDIQTGSLTVSREIDGKNSTGVIGDILTAGSGTIPNAAQLFNAQNSQKYRVSNLLADDNQVTSSDAKLFSTDYNGVAGDDDMYVAGDPGIGGKGNNYQFVDIGPVQAQTITMLEDGLDNGRKVTINAKIDNINDQMNKAFTSYGFVVQDDNGQKTQATLAGGQLTITAPNGQRTILAPPADYVIGNPNDPVGRFYFASAPGGENGTNEDRLIFEQYEKPTPDTIAQLVAQGVNPDEAANLRTTTAASFGFRIPDGLGNTYRQSIGVGAGQPILASNNVKTYYDAHFYEGPPTVLNFSKPVTLYRDQEVDVPRQVTKTIFVDQEQPVFDTVVTVKKDIKEDIFEDQPTQKTINLYDVPQFKEIDVEVPQQKTVFDYDVPKFKEIDVQVPKTKTVVDYDIPKFKEIDVQVPKTKTVLDYDIPKFKEIDVETPIFETRNTYDVQKFKTETVQTPKFKDVQVIQKKELQPIFDTFLNLSRECPVTETVNFIDTIEDVFIVTKTMVDVVLDIVNKVVTEVNGPAPTPTITPASMMAQSGIKFISQPSTTTPTPAPAPVATTANNDLENDDDNNNIGFLANRNPFAVDEEEEEEQTA